MFLKGALQEDLECGLEFGLALLHGSGVPQDQCAASVLFSNMALVPPLTPAHIVAHFYLGQMLLLGLGVKPDPLQGHRHVAIAASNGLCVAVAYQGRKSDIGPLSSKTQKTNDSQRIDTKECMLIGR